MSSLPSCSFRTQLCGYLPGGFTNIPQQFGAYFHGELLNTALFNRGVGRIFSRGGRVFLNVTFQKGYFCIDVSTNTLYRKCIKFAPKKGGGGSSDPLRPSPSYDPDCWLLILIFFIPLLCHNRKRKHFFGKHTH